jgi:regulation of enolase protein 1 (concanavalin A-like superfamily)
MTSFTLPAIPGECQWHLPPLDWSFTPEEGLSITAGAQTDWFIDPAGTCNKDNAPCLLFSPSDDNFLLSAKVAVAFGATYDAGTIQIRAADDLWAKLCLEYSPQGRPMVVSVVTRGVSDDCNSVEIERPEIHLRVARTPQTLAFHYSQDGRVWHFVRYFSLGRLDVLRAGFSAQSPTGEKCRAVFTEINYRQGKLKDNRSGK